MPNYEKYQGRKEEEKQTGNFLVIGREEMLLIPETVGDEDGK